MATMKDIIQSPLLLALFGSMALGLFASSASGSKVVKGGIKGVLSVLDRKSTRLNSSHRT